MYCIAFTPNDMAFEMDVQEREDGHFVNEVNKTIHPVFVIMHEKKELLEEEYMMTLIRKWKDSLRLNKRCVESFNYPEAIEDFLQWLEKQPYGFVIPKTEHGLWSLPIYDSW